MNPAPLHVAQIVPYYPPHEGGMETNTKQLVSHLPAAGVSTEVITSRIPSGPNEPGVRRLPALDIAHTPVMWGLIPALASLPSHCVVHVHVAQAFVPDIAAFVARRRHQPVVAHYHLDVDPSGPLGLLLRPYQRTLLRHTLRRADAVVVPTPDYADIVVDTYGVARSRVHVIPGATTLPVRERPREAPDGTVRLLSVGRLSEQKNHFLLLEAMHHLGAPADPTTTADETIAWSLDIVGEGEQRAALQRRITELGLDDRVTLRGGGFDGDRLRRWYDDADIFVLATRKESFGLVFVEAMTRALPIVSTEAPGVRNVVVHGRNGLLTRHEPAALAAALRTVAADRALYRTLSENNRTDAATYSWTVVAEQFARLYRSVSPT